MRWRQVAPVALVLALTVAGFVGARALGQRDARRSAEHRADVAAAQIRGRVEQGGSLAESLRRYMVGVAGAGVTSGDFGSNSSRWLSPAGFPAAAWVEQVPASRRKAYERRIGQPIVTRDARGSARPAGPRSSYLPATLVSGIPPMAVPGIDLARVSGMGGALARASSLYEAGATPLTTLRDGTRGLFLVRFAPRLAGGIVEPGFVVVFVSDLWLRAAATDTPALDLSVGGVSTGPDERGPVVHTTFTEAGQRFVLGVPRGSVGGAAAVLPWLILGAGLVLAALAGALGVNAARRAKAQDELDRIFTLSTDVIAVADFDGNFTRVNPAAEQILGYPREELLELPYLDLVHPDDRDRTAREAAAIGHGKTTLSFENRYVRKDGSQRVLEWTTTPVVEDRLMYSMARDVTERRQAELERSRLADEQAALRRVATLVARSVPAAEVFSAVAEEVERLLDAQATAIGRLESDGMTVIVASRGTASDALPVGSRGRLEPKLALAEVPGIRRTVAVAITVEGSLWGSIAAGTERDRFPPDAEQRVAEFTELAGTAISNIQARSDLAASRARIGTAADEERRRVVRDLHDGAQQRMVHTIMVLRQAQQGLPPDQEPASELVAEAIEQAERATDELRELAAGLLPSVLRHGGLLAGVRALASRMSVPVELDVSVDRLPAAVEATAYFVVAEALTNVTKHAQAKSAAVTAHVEDGTLRIRVRDDGVGGARPDGSGLVGLADRLGVLDGQLWVGSGPEGGTVLAADIPVSGHAQPS